MVRYFRLFLFCIGIFYTATNFAMAKPSIAGGAEAGPGEDMLLSITNNTSGELLGVRFIKNGQEHFARLDLGPEGSDMLENHPEGKVELRLDLGLELWFFDALSLKDVQKITAHEHEGPCLVVEGTGQAQHIKGRRQNLLPRPGDRPVCALTSFKPGMLMEDVCGLIEGEPQHDDNDAIITSLGYAGIVWAARLTPNQLSSGSGDKGTPVTLEHIELRQVLSAENIDRVRKTLQGQGYRPWQAEFPGMDLNFTAMTALTVEQQDSLLENLLALLLKTGTGEASIMLAPAQMIPELENSDGPQRDVQLFTLLINCKTKSLVVDLAAYSPTL